MSEASRISLTQQLWAVREIIGSRRAGYPTQVAKGKIRQAEADYRIATLEAAAGTLTTLIELIARHPQLAALSDAAHPGPWHIQLTPLSRKPDIHSANGDVILLICKDSEHAEAAFVIAAERLARDVVGTLLGQS